MFDINVMNEAQVIDVIKDFEIRFLFQVLYSIEKCVTIDTCFSCFTFGNHK